MHKGQDQFRHGQTKEAEKNSRNQPSDRTERKQIGGGYQPIQEVEIDPDQIEMEEQLQEDR